MPPQLRTPHSAFHTRISRRELLRLSGMGFGSLVLKFLLQTEKLSAETAPGERSAIDLRPKRPHFPAKAKSVILLMQNGGPSQMDLFDRKPMLQKFHGKLHSTKVEMFGKGSEKNSLLGSPFQFHHRGQCGMELSEVIPHIGNVADELCLIRSMHTGHNNHTEALIMFITGHLFQGRPSFGSWISYGLGTENRNLPAYVVLRDPSGYATSGSLTWSSGWLPTIFQGTEFSAEGTPVLNLRSAQNQPEGVQRGNLNFLTELNRLHQRKFPNASILETRIQNYELAARMQLAAGQALDISQETKATHTLYGLDHPTTRSYGLRCLMARKLVEAGVRFVQIHPKPIQPWDQHKNLEKDLTEICNHPDQPSAGLIADLKQRGLLEETIVIWSGEFGRLPVSQNGNGRDHNRNAFSLFVAGGGFKSGYVHGETDEVGYKAVVNRVSVADLHATILHQLGLDHDDLTFQHSGRDESLTDSIVTDASVVDELLDKPTGG